MSYIEKSFIFITFQETLIYSFFFHLRNEATISLCKKK